MKNIDYKSKQKFFLSSLLTIGFLSLLVIPACADGGRGKSGHGWSDDDDDHGHGGHGWSDDDDDHGYGRHGWNEDRIAKKLGLNAEQEEQLEVLLEEIEDQAEELHDNRKDWAEGLSAEVKKDTFDSGWLENRIQQQQQAQTELYRLIGANFAKFHALLNAEQREKLANYVERYESRGWFR